MPGGHNENTKLLGFFADKELTKKIDEARGGVVRSQFLREATVEYMVKKGIDVPEHLKHPPSRAGKGGPKPIDSYKKAAAKLRKKNKPGTE